MRMQASGIVLGDYILNRFVSGFDTSGKPTSHTINEIQLIGTTLILPIAHRFKLFLLIFQNQRCLPEYNLLILISHKRHQNYFSRSHSKL